MSLGRHAEALAAGERALAMVRRLGNQQLEGAACCALGNVRARSGALEEGRALLERAVALARAQDDPVLGVEACAYLANVSAWAGDPRRSQEVTALREVLAERVQDPFQRGQVDAWRASLCIGWGDWGEAERLLAQAERSGAGLESPQRRGAVRAQVGALRYYQGRFDEAEAASRAALEPARRGGGGALLWRLGWRGLVLAELGRREEALACLRELETLAEAQHERATDRGAALASLVVGYARLGAWHRAAACYPQLLPFAGHLRWVLLALVERALGLAATGSGDVATARRHFATAEAQARHARLRPELALTLLQRGQLEQHTGARADTARGQAAVAEGLRLCEALGMQALGRRVLEAAPLAGAARIGTQPWPGELTARQVEVLRLVAQGRSNQEIAAALSLSAGTVANHLTAIFTKTGADNRAGAVAYALRHGLI